MTTGMIITTGMTMTMTIITTAMITGITTTITTIAMRWIMALVPQEYRSAA